MDIGGELLDELWAVALTDSRYGGDIVRWSQQDHDWLPKGHRPSDEDVVEAVRVVRAFQQGPCRRCGLRSLADHFLTEDVFGHPAIGCLQLPDPRVVGGRSGRGRYKHWGSLAGCSAAEPIFLADSLDGSERIDYGPGLIAEEVVRRQWCSKCVSAAANVAERAIEDGATPEQHVRDMERELLRERRRNRP